jgi:hypothetical protein
LLKIADQVGPEIHQLALAHGPQALAFEMGGATMAAPKGLPGRTAVAPVGQAEAKGFRTGASIELPQAGGLQQLAGVHRRNSIHAADLREGQPLGDGTGRGHDRRWNQDCAHACQAMDTVNSSSVIRLILSPISGFLQD